MRSWSGLLLRRPIDMEKRDGIQRGEASLLDLRSYLFSRQCTLLIFLQRPWEVTQRALELLHNCVQELRLLEVNRLLLCYFFHVQMFIVTARLNDCNKDGDITSWWLSKTIYSNNTRLTKSEENLTQKNRWRGCHIMRSQLWKKQNENG